MNKRAKRKDHYLPVALMVLFVGGLGCLNGYTSQNAEDRALRIEAAHSALNMLTDTVDPAYEAARVGCNAADLAAVGLAKVDHITVAQLEAQVTENRARCDKTFAVFERLRLLQATAREALERAGNDETALQQTEAAIRDIRSLWRQAP